MNNRLDQHAYLCKWKCINAEFNGWYCGQTWDKQMKYLSKKINTEFKLSHKKIKSVFAQFTDVFPDLNIEVKNQWGWCWENYQLKLLMVLVANEMGH